MRRTLRNILLLSAAVLACLPVCALAQAQARSADMAKLTFTGDERALWILRDAGETFDVVTKPASGDWRWVMRDRPVPVPAAVAVGGLLHMVFPSGAYANIGQVGLENPGKSPQSVCWPDKSPRIILFGADDFAQGRSTVSALVARQAAGHASPSSQPAPPTAPTARSLRNVRLPTTRSIPAAEPGWVFGLFQYSQGQWAYLGDVNADDPVPAGRLGDVRAAAVGRMVCVYLPGRDWLLAMQAGVDGAASHMVLPGPDVEAMPGGGDAGRGAVLELLGVGRTLVMVLAGASQDGRREVYVATATFGDSTTSMPVSPQWFFQPMRRDGVPVSWADGAAPRICVVQDQLALLWSEDGKLRTATCDLSGGLGPSQDLSIFAAGPPDDEGQAIIQYFMMGVLVLLVLPMLAFRSRQPVGLPQFPPGRRPANLVRRLLAAVVDFVPMATMAGVIFPIPIPPAGLSNIQELMEYANSQGQTGQFAYLFICAHVLYVGYCIFMEARFGATVGKMIFRLRVVAMPVVSLSSFSEQAVRPSGGTQAGFVAVEARPDIRAAMLRNVSKIIELSLLMLPLLLLMPALSRARQRIGDMLARTVVIDATYLASGAVAPPMPGDKPNEPPQ